MEPPLPALEVMVQVVGVGGGQAGQPLVPGVLWQPEQLLPAGIGQYAGYEYPFGADKNKANKNTRTMKIPLYNCTTISPTNNFRL